MTDKPDQSWHRFLTTGFALAIFVAAPIAAHSDDCDAVAANLATLFGAKLTERTTYNVFLQHPKLGKFQVACPMIKAQHPMLTVDWKGAAPPLSFFDLTAHARAILTGAPEANLKRGAIRCWQMALKTAEVAEFTAQGIKFSCQAFVRDGGGVSIDIALADKAKEPNQK